MTGDPPSGSFQRSTHTLFEETQDADAAVTLGATELSANQKPPRNSTQPSFDQFYREEMAALVRFMRRYDADVHAAADAAHDAFTEAYPQWTTIENPRAWLRLVACRIYYRRRLRETPVEDVPDRPVIYQDTIEMGEQAHRVFEALAALPERQRQVMAWHLDSYDNTEIAEHLGITVAAVRQNLCRARRTLKQRLELGHDDQEEETQ